ncbi:MAG: orotidine-5'-phosphate decarboxylase [Candidatus Omnitrophota bacterium]|nr:orotidine-5'-phosphate decarboxylase [Candidatus Omnitrophota bacterium]
MNPESRNPRQTEIGLAKPELIVALDVDSLKKAEKFIDLLYPQVKIFKIGLQLFTLYGPGAVEMVHKKGAKVFLDLKFHDIPNTVAGAASSATSLGIFMFNVHAQGGIEMMQRAKEAACLEASKAGIKPPLIIAVTVLTSQINNSTILPLVLSFTSNAREAGLDGVVASVQEAGIIREKFGSDLVVVSPGIRPKGVDSGDQKRIATPQDAAKAGSDYIVVGRPILEAKDPSLATQRILKSLN